jgi:hypothetical protein
VRGGQDPSVAEAAGAALTRVQRTTANHVAVLTNSDYLANPRAVLEAKLPLLTQEARADNCRKPAKASGQQVDDCSPSSMPNVSKQEARVPSFCTLTVFTCFPFVLHCSVRGQSAAMKVIEGM